jgi:hypothetical protein
MALTDHHGNAFIETSLAQLPKLCELETSKTQEWKQLLERTRTIVTKLPVWPLSYMTSWRVITTTSTDPNADDDSEIIIELKIPKNKTEAVTTALRSLEPDVNGKRHSDQDAIQTLVQVANFTSELALQKAIEARKFEAAAFAFRGAVYEIQAENKKSKVTDDYLDFDENGFVVKNVKLEFRKFVNNLLSTEDVGGRLLKHIAKLERIIEEKRPSVAADLILELEGERRDTK